MKNMRVEDNVFGINWDLIRAKMFEQDEPYIVAKPVRSMSYKERTRILSSIEFSMEEKHRELFRKITDISDFSLEILNDHLDRKDGYMNILLLLVIPSYVCSSGYVSFNVNSIKFTFSEGDVSLMLELFSNGEKKLSEEFIRLKELGVVSKFRYDIYTASVLMQEPRRQIDSGQGKIFLSAIRTFINMSPGELNILVIGSASHVIQSGYTYTALARFLTLSGFYGRMSLWDSTELHNDYRCDNFDMVYVNRNYDYDTKVLVGGKYPDVILDDVYDPLNYVENHRKLVLAYKNARITTKYYGKLQEFVDIEHDIDEQFYYDGAERRIYYRVPKFRLNFIPPIFHQCSRCCYYSRCVTLIGDPKNDLERYWTILFSVVGHHCEAYSGIRNLKFIDMLRHEFIRGRTKDVAVINVAKKGGVPGIHDITTISRIVTMMENMGDSSLESSKVYVNPVDINNDIGSGTDIPTIVEKLLILRVRLNLIKSPGFNNDRFMKILYLYDSMVTIKTPVLGCMVSKKYSINPGLIYVDDYTMFPDDYAVLLEWGVNAILISNKLNRVQGWLLDKGGTVEQF